MSKGIPRKHKFFTSAKGDSPAKKLLIHLLLIMASVIALYPFLRVKMCIRDRCRTMPGHLSP